MVIKHLLIGMILQVDTKSPSTKMIPVAPAGDKKQVYSIDGYVLRVGNEGGICFIAVKKANTMIHSELSYIHILNVIFENLLTGCLKENGWRISKSPYRENTSTCKIKPVSNMKFSSWDSAYVDLQGEFFRNHPLLLDSCLPRSRSFNERMVCIISSRRKWILTGSSHLVSG